MNRRPRNSRKIMQSPLNLLSRKHVHKSETHTAMSRLIYTAYEALINIPFLTYERWSVVCRESGNCHATFCFPARASSCYVHPPSDTTLSLPTYLFVYTERAWTRSLSSISLRLWLRVVWVKCGLAGSENYFYKKKYLVKSFSRRRKKKKAFVVKLDFISILWKSLRWVVILDIGWRENQFSFQKLWQQSWWTFHSICPTLWRFVFND